MAIADVGDKRAFLITSMKFLEGGQRVEQIQQIVDCMQAAHLYVENDNVVFGPGSSDSRDSSCAVRIVATVGDGAQDTAKRGKCKRVAGAFPHSRLESDTHDKFAMDSMNRSISIIDTQSDSVVGSFQFEKTPGCLSVRKAAGVFGTKYRATYSPHGPRSFRAVVGCARAICAYPGRSVGRPGRRIPPVGRCS